MKVSFRPITNTPGSYTLFFDEAAVAAGPVLQTFIPEFHPQPQQEPLAGSVNPFLNPRASSAVTFMLAVYITYATTELAFASTLDPNIIQLREGQNHLLIEDGVTKHYYPNAVCTGHRHERTGITVLHTFSFASQNVTTTDPE